MGSDGPDKFWGEVSEDLFHHFLQAVFGCPVPISSCFFIHEEVGPTLGDVLPDLFNFVDHFEGGYSFFYLRCDFHGGEVHSLDVVAGSDG